MQTSLVLPGQFLVWMLVVVAKVDSFLPHHTATFKYRHQAFINLRQQNDSKEGSRSDESEKVIVVGAGWGGLSAAHALSSLTTLDDGNHSFDVTVVEASPRVGGLVRDGFRTTSGQRPAEAGQHGFWNNYKNIFRLLREQIPSLDIEKGLTQYAEQGQYSPRGLEAVWPVYKDQSPQLPTGLAQAAYTRFFNLSLFDRLTAFPLVLAFSEFDDSPEAWERFDQVSFRDLCMRLGVSRKCYDEAFEPMILTGLFAPGAECSAAAALGMAYFFVLQSQNAFDVQWCAGNIGEIIFDPWVDTMTNEGNVNFETSTRVTGFEMKGDKIVKLRCLSQSEGGPEEKELQADHVIFAVGATALNSFVRNSPELACYDEFRGFANLRGTSVLATRIFLDRSIDVPYSANACWGFDKGIGMTMFDIRSLHGAGARTVADAPGSVLEVDYYHSSNLLVMNDADIVEKVKHDLDIMLGSECRDANVVDAAVVRLPNAVNWYYPGSYKDMPDVKSTSVDNLYFCGDIVRTRHGSWSQEKAFVTGMEAANLIAKKPIHEGILPVAEDELHVQFGRRVLSTFQRLVGGATKDRRPSLVDFLL